MKVRYVFILFLLFNFSMGHGKTSIPAEPDTIPKIETHLISDTLVIDSCAINIEISGSNTKHSDSVVVVKNSKNKKTIAAILAFPLPFGVLGLHRVFLGTKPYMPFAYLGSLGGCFGILPLIDFINILTANKVTYTNFENNPNVFMWAH